VGALSFVQPRVARLLVSVAPDPPALLAVLLGSTPSGAQSFALPTAAAADRLNSAAFNASLTPPPESMVDVPSCDHCMYPRTGHLTDALVAVAAAAGAINGAVPGAPAVDVGMQRLLRSGSIGVTHVALKSGQFHEVGSGPPDSPD